MNIPQEFKQFQDKTIPALDWYFDHDIDTQYDPSEWGDAWRKEFIPIAYDLLEETPIVYDNGKIYMLRVGSDISEELVSDDVSKFIDILTQLQTYIPISNSDTIEILISKKKFIQNIARNSTEFIANELQSELDDIEYCIEDKDGVDFYS